MNARDEVLELAEELNLEGHALLCLVKWLPLNKVEDFLDDFKRIELAN